MSEKYQIENKAQVWQAWAQTQTTNSLEVFDSYGIGLRAPKPFKQGDVLLRVPNSLCISSSTCLDEKMAKWLLECTGQGPHMLQKVVVYLALAQSTPWTPYFKLLPSPADLSLPFTWTKEDIDDLNGTSIGDATVTKRRFIDAMLRSCPPLEGMTPALWHLAYEWIASRALTHPQTGQHVLVPVLDLVNHSSCANARYDFDGRDFLLFATSDIQAGNEICIDYGVRSAGEFLFKYGFVPTDPDTQITRTYDPMAQEIRQILDVSRDPEVSDDDQLKKELETAYLILLQFVGGAATFRIEDGQWTDDLIVLVACEDALELRNFDGQYDLYIGENPIEPSLIQDLRTGEIAERANKLAHAMARHFEKVLPEPTTEQTRALVEHEREIYTRLTHLLSGQQKDVGMAPNKEFSE